MSGSGGNRLRTTFPVTLGESKVMQRIIMEQGNKVERGEHEARNTRRFILGHWRDLDDFYLRFSCLLSYDEGGGRDVGPMAPTRPVTVRS